jgi:hypothetical protein
MKIVGRLIGLVGIHRWRAMKWGSSDADCRECRWCGCFQVWAFLHFRTVDRTDFWEIRDV